MKTKMINWSYPSSANASKFGFAKGCFTVSERPSKLAFSKPIAGFATFEEAKVFADAIPCEYDRYTETFYLNWVTLITPPYPTITGSSAMKGIRE